MEERVTDRRERKERKAREREREREKGKERQRVNWQAKICMHVKGFEIF